MSVRAWLVNAAACHTAVVAMPKMWWAIHPPHLRRACGVKNELWHGGETAACREFGSKSNARQNFSAEAAVWRGKSW